MRPSFIRRLPRCIEILAPTSFGFSYAVRIRRRSGFKGYCTRADSCKRGFVSLTISCHKNSSRKPSKAGDNKGLRAFRGCPLSTGRLSCDLGPTWTGHWASILPYPLLHGLYLNVDQTCLCGFNAVDPQRKAVTPVCHDAGSMRPSTEGAR